VLVLVCGRQRPRYRLRFCRMRVCGFCDGSGVDQEHVWPDWLRKVIFESRAAGGMKHFHAEIERTGETKKFKSPKFEIKVGMPCESCNHGWMSGSEAKYGRSCQVRRKDRWASPAKSSPFRSESRLRMPRGSFQW
jgi:hypothetical protein